MVSIAWAYSAYYRSNREVSNEDNKEDICNFVLIVYFLAATCCLIPRFVSGALFAAEFKSNNRWLLAAGSIGLAHILFLFLYICIKLKPKLEGTAHNLFVKLLYYFFFAYVNFFLFMNLGGRGSPKMKFEMYLRYGIIYFENILLSIPLIIYKSSSSQVFPMLGVVLVSSILHCVLLNVFYRLLHPRTGRYKNFDPFEECYNRYMKEADDISVSSASLWTIMLLVILLFTLRSVLRNGNQRVPSGLLLNYTYLLSVFTVESNMCYVSTFIQRQLN